MKSPKHGPRQNQSLIAGADGYRGDLVVAFDDGERSWIERVSDFAALFRRPDLDVLVVDVPIGLLEAGGRECDFQARKLLGRRRNSVFTAPLASMLRAQTWEEACGIREEIEGKRCSRQVFGIIPLIRAVDDAITPELQRRVREGHPEVSFAAIRGDPMDHHKGTEAGRAERLGVLKERFPDIEQSIERFGRQGALVDIHDAYALLWTARRVRAGESQSIPKEPEFDARGLRAEIVF